MIGEEQQNQSRQFVEFFVGSKVDVQATLDKYFPGVEPPHNQVVTDTGGIPRVQLIETGRRMSQVKGPKIFKEVIKVRIVNSQRSRQELEVDEAIKRQYSSQWVAFTSTPEYQAFIQRQETGHADYRPIKELEPVIGPAALASLKDAGITSIEQLIECEDTAIDHIPQWKKLKAAAEDLNDDSAIEVPETEIVEEVA